MDGARLKKVYETIGRWPVVFAAAAIVCFLLSLHDFSAPYFGREVRRVQNALHQREDLLDKYVERAFGTAESEWDRMEGLPDDFVIYKYVSDSLRNWENVFPISNDNIRTSLRWYRIYDMNVAGRNYAPLSYLTEESRFINLGPGWYVVKSETRGDVTVVSGILVETEYASENEILRGQVNSRLRLSPDCDIAPLVENGGNIVFGREGTPLFSVTAKEVSSENGQDMALRWMAVLFMLAAVFLFHSSKRTIRSFILTLCVIVLAMVSVPEFHLLLLHAGVFMLTGAAFIIRKTVIRSLRHLHGWKKVLGVMAIIAATLCLAAYIDITFRSFILHSDVTLELYKLNEISVWTVVIYASYAFLFLGLLFCLYILRAVLKRKRRRHTFSAGIVHLYILLVSIYSCLAVIMLSFRKEYEENRVLTERMAVERDLPLEMRLVDIESRIRNDQLLKMLVNVRGGESMIAARISDRYLWDIQSKYNLRVTVCGEGQFLLTDNYPYPVNCRSFFTDEIIGKYGVRIVPWSSFFFVDDYGKETKYIGMFGYFSSDNRADLYVEIESKPRTDVSGYPLLLTRTGVDADKGIPSNASYAKYYDGRLVLSKGQYEYPAYFDLGRIEEGYSYAIINGYRHFYNKVSPDCLIVTSRPVHTVAQYLVTCSYLFLFYGVVILGILDAIRRRHSRRSFSFQMNSFRKKITVLLTASMVVALVAIGVGSVIYIISLMEEGDRRQMKEKLQTVQSVLNSRCRYARSAAAFDEPGIAGAVRGLSSNINADINIFDSHGKLFRSTRPEVFDQYLLSSRMNSEAYQKIIYERKMQFINTESIAGMTYYSLYAPVINSTGEMVGIVNIPYFTDYSGYRTGDHSAIVAAVINIFLLLLVGVILGGVAMANSISRPLSYISRKMSEMDIYENPEHINFHNDDELGRLVDAYNKMVDDLDRSTKMLAQSEREQAWGEMARQIAHEIKNPLTPMKLSIQHIIRMKKMNAPGWEDRLDALAASLIEQIDILSNTASEFSSFAKFYNEEDSDFDLTALLREQSMLFDTLDTIRMEFVFGVEPALVCLKKSQITRAFVNLISNAIQALGGSRGGLVRVTLSRDLGFFRICVEDNGPGVSPENRGNLFRPNFTTKSSGTGLGLAITRNIIEQSGGKIWYEESELGGANFTLLLPVKK